jgi:hypothetical protein
VTLDVEVLRSVGPGEEVALHACAKKIGKTLAFLDMRLDGSDGKPVRPGDDDDDHHHHDDDDNDEKAIVCTGNGLCPGCHHTAASHNTIIHFFSRWRGAVT